jgi:hypothetical protein
MRLLSVDRSLSKVFGSYIFRGWSGQGRIAAVVVNLVLDSSTTAATGDRPPEYAADFFGALRKKRWTVDVRLETVNGGARIAPPNGIQG